MHQPVSIPVSNTDGGFTSPPPQPANAVYSSFLHDLIFVCCGTIGAAYLVVVLIGVPISMIYFGYTKQERCPVEPMIPIYLILSGSFSIFRTIWYFLEYWLFRRHLGVVLNDYVDSAMCITTALMATLYFFGLFWVLRVAWPNLENPRAFNYCDPTVYCLAFCTIMGVLILMLFWCMCICILAFQVVPVVNEEVAMLGIPVAVPPQPQEFDTMDTYNQTQIV